MSVRENVESFISFLYSLLEDDSYLGGDISSKTAYRDASLEGLQVVLPETNQLFVDIDSDFAFLTYEKNLKAIYEWYEVEGEPIITPSRSGGERKHIIITLSEPIGVKDRLILQAFLGSDLRREFLGLQRIRQKDPNPTLFLEKKENAIGLSI
jgi:hypothetical protein